MKQTNKKSMALPEKIPHLQKQINGNTPGSKNQQMAQMLFDMIGKYDRPIKRPKNQSVDRMLRMLIEHANNNGDCIINDGDGYYRPKRGDGFDEHCFNLYAAKELKKAKAIEDKIKSMKNAFYGGTN